MSEFRDETHDTNPRRTFDQAKLQWGLHLAARGGKQAKNKSVVAVVRKLAVLLHHLWTTQEPYIPFYQQAA